MKGFLAVSCFLAVAIICGSAQVQQPYGSEEEGLSVDSNANILVPAESDVHGRRMKRSPADPFLAPLLVGKSFLLGALLGPKLLGGRHGRRGYYGGYGHGHGYGHGYGHGHGHTTVYYVPATYGHGWRR